MKKIFLLLALPLCTPVLAQSADSKADDELDKASELIDKMAANMHAMSVQLMGVSGQAAYAKDFCGDKSWKASMERTLNKTDAELRPQLKAAFDEGWATAKTQAQSKKPDCGKK